MAGLPRWPLVFVAVAAHLVITGCAGAVRQAPPAAAAGPAPSAAPAAQTTPAHPAMAVVSPPALVEEDDPADLVIVRADDLFEQGMALLSAGDLDAARRAFNAAVEVYLDRPADLLADARLSESFEDLVESIHQAEVEWRESRGESLVRAEDLREISAYLSPEEAEREQEKVRQRSATVVFDVPVEINDRVVAFIDAFSGPRKRLFEPGMVRSGKYVAMARSIFREEGVPQDLVYLAHIESAFKPNAYSRARAKGLFQFIASTGRNYGLRSDWWVDMRADPELAARASARYLKTLHGIYGDWYLAMAEYNGGPRVRRAWERSGRTADFWDLAAGRSLRPETRNYVPQILAAIVLHKSPEKYGLTTRREPALRYDTVELDHSLDLRVAARLAGTTVEEMIELNPGLRRLATPPDYKRFPLRVPADTGSRFQTELAKLPASERLPWYRHSVRRGETLSTIAARYGASVHAIVQANGLRNPHRIAVGQSLMIPGSAVRVAALDAPPPTDRVPQGTRQVHRVSRGDTLSSIARRYRTDVRSVVAWNGLTDASLIRPGQRLVVYAGTRATDQVPSSGPSRARAGGAGRERQTVSYTVRRGDTLYSIARRHRVSVSALQKWNGLGRSTTIRPGDLLKIHR